MSPRTKVDRDDWIAAVLAMLDQDRIPTEVSLTELSAFLDVTKGSFYSHFRDGGLAALHTAVIAEWLRVRVAALPDKTVGAVRDPLDRIRMIRAAVADSAVRDDAMRRWAGGNQAAAKAMAEADRIVTGHLDQALVHLGFTGGESAALAGILAAALREQTVAGDPEGFEIVLQVLTRAAAAPDAAMPELTDEQSQALLTRLAHHLFTSGAAETQGQAGAGEA